MLFRTQIFVIVHPATEFVVAASVSHKINIYTQNCGAGKFWMCLTFMINWKFFYNLLLGMDYVESGDLLSNMEVNKTAIPKASVIFICAEVLEGLDFLHTNMIVYRDLKHENILVHSGNSNYQIKVSHLIKYLDGHVKLSDFGLCKDLSECEFTNSFCGTPGYIAPEIYETLDYNYTCDWWSYGVFVYELLTNGSMWYLCKENSDGMLDDIGLKEVCNFILKQK